MTRFGKHPTRNTYRKKAAKRVSQQLALSRWKREQGIKQKNTTWRH